MRIRAIAAGTVALLTIVVLVMALYWMRTPQSTRTTQVNPAPRVIPSLREWRGASGWYAFGPASRLVLDPSAADQLGDTVAVFQSDLSAIVGRAPLIVSTPAPQSGDIVLALSGPDTQLGAEGYLLTIGATTTIRAPTRAGVFYGTRSVLQMLAQDVAHSRLPKGAARDFPTYQERGFMLDVARKFFSLDFLKDYVRFMAWFKLNDFHLHLNDNELNGGDAPDWSTKYAAFRLKSDRFPTLAAKDGAYSRQDMRELQDLAKRYGVTITPEIDAPAHALALTQFRPDLASPTYSKEFLDLNNPASYTLLDTLWDEFLPWFDAPAVHIGADEYAPDDADNYRRFITRYNIYLRGKGKTVRMWGSLTQLTSAIAVPTDITIDLWDNLWANPREMTRQGFNIINMNDNLLYIVPKSGYFPDYLDTKYLYETWEPYIFDRTDASLNLDPQDPHLLGAMFAVWNDRLGSAISDADVHARVKPAMPTLAQKLWSASTANASFADFQHLATTLGDAPNTRLPAN